MCDADVVSSVTSEGVPAGLVARPATDRAVDRVMHFPTATVLLLAFPVES